MIFGSALYYLGILNSKLTEQNLLFFTVTLLVSMLVWLFMGDSLAFSGDFWMIGDMHKGLFHLANLNAADLLESLFQLCFCLYAVVMLIGAIMDRETWIKYVVITGLWVLFVYAPLARWFWSDVGWLKEIGVLDYSGGMVVHISAGVSSFILAWKMGRRKLNGKPSKRHFLPFLGTIFICAGWFGFNAGPAGELNKLAIVILFNTFLVIVCGSVGTCLASYLLTKKITLLTVLNGMIVGLVASTSSVGYTAPLYAGLIAAITGFIYIWINDKWLEKVAIDDAVGSFGMNGIGGIVGSLATGVFANKKGILFCGNMDQLLKQLLGVGITIIFSIVMTLFICRIVTCFIHIYKKVTY